MNLTGIFAIFSLILFVKGACWITAVHSVLLSLGTIYAAIDHNVIKDLEHIEWKNFLPFINKQDETPKEPHDNPEPMTKEELIKEQDNIMKELEKYIPESEKESKDFKKKMAQLKETF